MQPVNDDMDHLFRQAADNYPLNTQGADFDKLQQRIQLEEAEVPSKKGRGRHFAWLLLLLIFLPFICDHQDKNVVKENTQLATQHTGTNGKLATQDLPDQKRAAIESDSSSADLTIKRTTLATNNTSSPAQPTKEDVVIRKDASTNQQVDNGTGSSLLLNSKKVVIENQQPVNGQANALQQKKNKSINNKLNSSINSNSTQDVAIIKSGQTASLKNSNKPIADQDFDNLKNDSAIKDAITNATQIARQQPDTTPAIVKKAALKDSNTQATIAQKKQLKEQEKLKAHFYAGIVAGPDYSVVKSTRTGGTGYNAGLVAGYRFGKHWAVETGLLWNHKIYYSEGEYASIDNLQLPMHTQVSHINGYCDMLEIPLNVQYHFSSKNKGHWYVAAGLSSYLMKKEEYYYLYKRYNMDYYGEKEYFNSTNNWFSVLQLGGGYQVKLGKQSSLRVEPYAKLPVSGIGIAKLPLSSTGVNIGYIKSF